MAEPGLLDVNYETLGTGAECDETPYSYFWKRAYMYWKKAELWKVRTRLTWYNTKLRSVEQLLE